LFHLERGFIVYQWKEFISAGEKIIPEEEKIHFRRRKSSFQQGKELILFVRGEKEFILE
jgi:hypothetical protein